MLADPGRRCPDCGITLREILGIRRTGCAGCYTAFRRELEPLRPRARGPAESGETARWKRWRELRARLDEAILVENFERAAVLKARLARLRTGEAPSS